MHLPSASLGLNVKGLRGFPVIGFVFVLFYFDGRHAKADLGISPPKQVI